MSSTYTFIIEDSFPNYGDYDFNDAVIKVQMETSMKDDYVQFANIKLTFRALGGTKRAGAFIHLPGIKSKDIQKAELPRLQNRKPRLRFMPYRMIYMDYSLFMK